VLQVCIITGLPNGPVLFCLLASVVVVCNTAGGRRAGQARGQSAAVGPATSVVGRPTLHGGPVGLRPVRVTRCIGCGGLGYAECSSNERLSVSLALSTSLCACSLHRCIL